MAWKCVQDQHVIANKLQAEDVLNFQRRVAGVLPVKVDVPKGGKSYRFVRPLVMDDEMKVTFHTSRGSEER